MKTIFIFLMAAAPVLTWGQSAKADIKNQKQLKKEILKSYYFQQFPDMNVDFYAKKYSCLQTHYNENVRAEKEFLSKKDFFKLYPNWQKQADDDIEYRSLLQEGLQFMHFNHTTKKHDVFPKCIDFNETGYQ